MRISKEAGIPALIATGASLVTLLGIMWVLVKPAIADSVFEALKGDIKRSVQEEVGPIRGGFDVLLSQQIIQTQKAIALLERKGITNLTAEETTQLVDLRAQLSAQQMALQELRR